MYGLKYGTNIPPFQDPEITIDHWCMEVATNGGVPPNHPLQIGIVPYKPATLPWVIPIYGNSHMVKWSSN